MKQKLFVSIFFFFLLIFLIKSHCETLRCGDIGGLIIKKKINPLIISDIRILRLSNLIFNKLFEWDKEEKKMQPFIAESITKADNNKYILKLKPNLKWHNGVYVDVKDIKYSFELAKKNKRYSKILAPIEKMEIIDNITIEIYLNSEVKDITSILGFEIMTDTSYPIGTGMYMLQPKQEGNQLINSINTIELIKNNDFLVKTYNNIDKIIHYSGDEDDLSINLDNKHIDLIVDYPIRSIYLYNNKQGYEVARYLPNFYYFIAVNLKNPLFSDARVRTALTYAINRKKILEDIFMNQGSVVSGPIPPGSWGDSIDVRPLEFRRDEALKLLKQAGFKDINGDGILDKDGIPFEFELNIPFYIGNRKTIREIANMASHIVSDWKKIGVLATVTSENKEALEERLENGNFKAVLWQLYMGPDNDLYPLFHSKGDYNYIKFDKPEIDALLEKEKQIEKDITLRRQIKEKLHYMLSDAVYSPFIFLVAPDKFTVYRTNLKNFRTNIDNYNFFKYIDKWEIK